MELKMKQEFSNTGNNQIFISGHSLLTCPGPSENSSNPQKIYIKLSDNTDSIQSPNISPKFIDKPCLLPVQIHRFDLLYYTQLENAHVKTVPMLQITMKRQC